MIRDRDGPPLAHLFQELGEAGFGLVGRVALVVHRLNLVRLVMKAKAPGSPHPLRPSQQDGGRACLYRWMDPILHHVQIGPPEVVPPWPAAQRESGEPMRLCRIAALILGLLLPIAAHAQDLDVDSVLVQEVFPGVTRVGPASGKPPVYKAFAPDASGKDALVGYLFLTSDWPPEESGYSGPILSLVGLDLDGMITGTRVLDYHESLRSSRGDFLAGSFERQFAGKRLADPFRVRRDVDNVSGATITAAATARSIRNSARRVATTYLNTAKGEVTAEEIEKLAWPELVMRGLGDRLQGVEKNLLRIELYLVPLEGEAMGRALIGDVAWDKAILKLGERATTKNLWMVGVDGGLEALFRASALQILRGNDTLKFEAGDLALAGEPRAGKVDSQFRNVGLLAVDPAIDPKQKFTWKLQFGGGIQPYSVEHPGEHTAVVAAAPTPPPATPGTEPGAASAGAAGTAPLVAGAPGSDAPPTGAEAGAPIVANQEAPLLDETTVDFSDEQEETILERTMASTDWRHFEIIAFVLALATAAFFSKNLTLRWVSLGTTLLILGFGSATWASTLGMGGFLSVSHITSAIKVGPKVFLEDLPLLLLVAFTVVTTLLWGRVFCGYLCPFGALQDFMEHIVPKKLRKKLPHPTHESGLYAKYAILGVIVLWSFVDKESSIFQYFEPFGTVFFWSKSAVLWLIAGTILVASAIIPRFYCRYACPLGASLALASILSPFRMKRVAHCQVCTMCEHSCPTGAILRENIDFKECVRCNVCEVRLIERAGVCKHDLEMVSHLIQIKRGLHHKHQPVPFPEAVNGD
ncbi:MAG: 4Fe-4S binding protein [Gemmatimonadetes bacterium]|nr:4Fe-4S binding protein [Gemmatimonadota bacterium]